MNTERIDVLAVLDFHLSTRDGGLPGSMYANEHAQLAAARAAVAELVEAADKAKAALLTGQIGHINAEDVGVYHLDGITCGNALNALRAALARVGGAA